MLIPLLRKNHDVNDEDHYCAIFTLFHLISPMSQILLCERAAADEVAQVSCASWEHFVSTPFGEAKFRKPTKYKMYIGFKLA